MWRGGGHDRYEKPTEPLFRVLRSLESYEFELHHEVPYVKEDYDLDPILDVLKEMPVKRARVILSGYQTEEVRVSYRRFACQIELGMILDTSGGPRDLHALCKGRLRVEQEEREALIMAREEKNNCPHADQESGGSAPTGDSATATGSLKSEKTHS